MDEACSGKIAPMNLPRVRIVTPALAAANNGNAHTAARWQHALASIARVEVALDWHGEAADALIALHARRSGDAIARFHEAHPQRPLAVVLTGTDLYRDLPADAKAQHSLGCASHLVVLQEEALRRLDGAARSKARCIVQSATHIVRKDKSGATVDLVAVGHLRAEKDPLTLMRAACALPPDSPVRVMHIGNALDDALADAARRSTSDCLHYRWLGGLPAGATRDCIARAHALVHMSRIEGGANVVIEAVRSRVPVLASRIDGNVGLLGADYEGYFPVGDATALATLMQRFAAEPAFAARLAEQCAQREPLFTPEAEAAAVKGLLHDMLAHDATIGRTTKDLMP
jgi:putative glycosyltransferase (TIGR04348 family)